MNTAIISRNATQLCAVVPNGESGVPKISLGNGRVKSKGKVYRVKVSRNKSLVERLSLLWDTGSNSHITDNECAFVPGSTRKCNVGVGGISSTTITATMYGSVMCEIAEGVTVLLEGVLLTPNATLGESNSSNTPKVLVGASRFAAEHDFGLHFLAGGKDVEFTPKGASIPGAFGKFTTDCPGLYTQVQGSAVDDPHAGCGAGQVSDREKRVVKIVVPEENGIP